ncbi:restriction endonuclease, partial [Rhizobium sp. BR 315]
MAKRSSKKNNLESFYAIIILSFSMCTYMITNSLTAVIMVAATILVFIIFILFLLNRKKINRLKNSGISDIDQMDGFQFEYYLNELFKSNGYTSQVTKSRGDYGADLILKRDGEVIAVQAKRHSKPVGLKAIQEITAAKGFYRANKAWVVTNNSFTKQAINLASSLDVKLIGREELI